jgi:hypothetical protein
MNPKLAMNTPYTCLSWLSRTHLCEQLHVDGFWCIKVQLVPMGHGVLLGIKLVVKRVLRENQACWDMIELPQNGCCDVGLATGTTSCDTDDIARYSFARGRIPWWSTL